jgi:O-acetyl-ADP-ribose deacetylase (regulator of RNase III)
MLRYIQGDIFKSDAEALVNAVNCVGVMGRGIALQFKKIFPDNFKAYVAACKRNEVQPGRLFIFETKRFTKPRYIVNFPTKRHWRDKSRIEDIEAGLATLAKEIQLRDIRSIAIPQLGCGLGGLNWVEVRHSIEHFLESLSWVRIDIFEQGKIV